MHEDLIDMLQCPVCHAELDWKIQDRRGRRIESAKVSCHGCAAAYVVQEGIGVFLTPDLPRNDLWEQRDSWLIQHLRNHPEIEQQLMDPPLTMLAAADKRFRANVLEDRGQYDEAKAIRDASRSEIYTAEYCAASAAQTEFVLSSLGGSDGLIVDLASGSGSLIEEMAHRLTRPLVATDFSPSILRRDRARWQHHGLYDRVSLMAFDARRTPFRDGAVETMTSCLGLPNIEEPGALLEELHRIVGGVFLAISHFYDEEDQAHAQMIREAQLETSLYRTAALQAFADAGWQVEVTNPCSALAKPTPRSALLDAGIDGFPVAQTILEFCVLIARRDEQGAPGSS